MSEELATQTASISDETSQSFADSQTTSLQEDSVAGDSSVTPHAVVQSTETHAEDKAIESQNNIETTEPLVQKCIVKSEGPNGAAETTSATQSPHSNDNQRERLAEYRNRATATLLEACKVSIDTCKNASTIDKQHRHDSDHSAEATETPVRDYRNAADISKNTSANDSQERGDLCCSTELTETPVQPHGATIGASKNQSTKDRQPKVESGCSPERTETPVPSDGAIANTSKNLSAKDGQHKGDSAYSTEAAVTPAQGHTDTVSISRNRTTSDNQQKLLVSDHTNNGRFAETVEMSYPDTGLKQREYAPEKSLCTGYGTDVYMPPHAEIGTGKNYIILKRFIFCDYWSFW